MSESPTKLLDDRIAALISRLKALAAERDRFQQESLELKSLLESRDHDNAKLRSVLDEAVRELRQE